MKFIISVILCIILAAICESLLPWWSITIAAFAVGLIMKMKGGISFLMGFTGIFLFWLVAMLLRDIPNHHILSQKMAQLFKLPNTAVLMFVVAMVGGLVGGLSALSGALIAKK